MSGASYFDAFITDSLVGFVIVERLRGTGTVLVSYRFPSCDATLQRVLLSRLSLDAPAYGCFKDTWHYSFPASCSRERTSDASLGPTDAAVFVLSHTLAPERYLPLAKTLADVYASTHEPVSVVRTWMSAFTTGSTESGWSHDVPDAHTRAVNPPGLRRVLACVGPEFLFAWSALLLRKRVFVYAPSVSDAVKAVRVLPCALPHRLLAEDGTGKPDVGVHLTPLVTLSVAAEEYDASTRSEAEAGVSAQVHDLHTRVSYVAGTTDAAVLGRGGDLWDVCISLDAANPGVTVAESAKGDLGITAVHKDVGKALLAALDAPDCSDASLIAMFREKNAALLSRLQSVVGKGVEETAEGMAAFREAIKGAFANAEGAVAPTLERFLWQVATAEMRAI